MLALRTSLPEVDLARPCATVCTVTSSLEIRDLARLVFRTHKHAMRPGREGGHVPARACVNTRSK